MNRIASVTVGAGGAASISFSNIPQTYTNLIILLSTRSAAANNVDAVYVRLNGASSGYTNRVLYGETTGTGSFTPSLSYAHCGYGTGGNQTASVFGNGYIYIPNYAGSNNKVILSDSVTESNANTYQSGVQAMTASVLTNTAAVTSITLTQESASNFAQYSTATLYGIKNS